MSVSRSHRSLLTVLALVAATGCAEAADSTATAYEGARIIPGDGSAVIENGVMVVDGGQIVAVGAAGAVDVPSGAATVDLAGKTVMPAIVNAHIHLAGDDRELRTRQRRHMAYYGASAVVSLGLDGGDLALDMRSEDVPDGARAKTAGRGITSPEPGRSEVPHWVSTEDEARAAVQELADDEVDIIKIWVDSRNFLYTPLSAELYGAVIDEAHTHGIRVTAHVFTLEDAKGLLRAGIDAFAHGIRDMDIDQELLDLWLDRPEVVLVPNLPGPGVPYDVDWVTTVADEDMAGLREAAARESGNAQDFFGIQARNLQRLSEEGVRIAFGTDGSTAWAAHLEMEDMVRAGMSPEAVITAATGTSAEFMEWDDTGVLTAGMRADFIVLDANPLEDITNTRMIADVYLAGAAIDRAAIAATERGAGAQ